MNLEKSNCNNSLLEKIKAFENIKTPDGLLSFMENNIHYGFVGKNNKKIYAYDDERVDADFLKEYYLQSPKELLDSGYGVCWDSAEFERQWFSEHGYNNKVFFMMFAKEEGTDLPTHTFLVFNQDDKWQWFEHSFGDYRGIHEYDNLEDLIEDVKRKHYEHAAQNKGAKTEDFNFLKICEYKKPVYGSSPKEFVSNIFKDNPELFSKE